MKVNITHPQIATIVKYLEGDGLATVALLQAIAVQADQFEQQTTAPEHWPTLISYEAYREAVLGLQKAAENAKSE